LNHISGLNHNSGSRPALAAGGCGRGVRFCVLFIQRGREKSAKGAYLEVSASSKH
jgi:hypothetical protein